MKADASETYVVMWSQDRVRWLRRIGDDGPLEVVFGGPHISQPSIDRMRVGDAILPLAATQGKLFVLARLLVEQLLDPDEFVESRLGLQRGNATAWSEFKRRLPDGGRGIGHRIPSTCADLAARGTGSRFRWDRSVPPEMLEQLRFGPKPGKESAPKGIVGGMLKSASSFQGHVRRASNETGALLQALVASGSD